MKSGKPKVNQLLKNPCYALTLEEHRSSHGVEGDWPSVSYRLHDCCGLHVRSFADAVEHLEGQAKPAAVTTVGVISSLHALTRLSALMEHFRSTTLPS